jgi:hypothetical protein
MTSMKRADTDTYYCAKDLWWQPQVLPAEDLRQDLNSVPSFVQ